MISTRLTLPVKFLGSTAPWLVDTGASTSTIPYHMVRHVTLTPTSITCSGANNVPIKCFGEITTFISIRKLRREFHWTFLVSDVHMPILGMDFLRKFNLIIDCGQQTVKDSLTTVVAPLTVLQTSFITPIYNTITHENSFIANLLQKFPALTQPVHLPTTDNTIPGPCHYIETGDSPPVFARPRRLTDEKLQAVKDEFTHLLKAGIIEPSESSWSSPIHLVKKANGGWRVCGDYRALNSVTRPDKYPIPNIQTVSDRLYGSTVFSKIDLQQAYHQIKIRPEDRPKTAVTTPFGLYQYLSVPFGLKNSCSAFQRIMDSLFRELPFLFVYLDDILCFSTSEEEHKQHLHKVFEILDKHKLRISLEKCSFFQTSINFLGFNISKDGICPPAHKRSEICDYPLPQDAPALARFLGMIGFYRRFIPSFSETVFLLSEKARHNLRAKSLTWTQDEIHAFEDIKSKLNNATTLPYHYPNITNLQLVTDSSSHAIGAVLHQMVDGKPIPIEFFSRKLSDTERRYSTFDRELLAAFKATLHFKHLLEGRSVLLVTDHKPLVAAFYSRAPAKSEKQQRQIGLLTEFITDATYLKGENNVVADALSRISSVSVDPVDLPSIAAHQEADEEFQQCKDKLHSIPLTPTLSIWCVSDSQMPRPFVPLSMREDIFNQYHQMSHPGVHGSQQLVGSRFYWPSLKKDIATWVKTCPDCQSSKIHKHTKLPIFPMQIPSARFETVHIDVVGPFPPAAPSGSSSSLAFRYLLTCIDRNTNWVEAYPLIHTTADAIAGAFLSWVSRFGVPLYVITDRGPQFESAFFAKLSSLIGFHRLRTSSYRPQTNGRIERMHRSLKNALRARKTDWLLSLQVVLFGLRCLPDESGYSPFQLVTGKLPLSPIPLLSHTPTNKKDHQEFLDNFVKLMKTFDYRVAQPLHEQNRTSYIPKELQTCSHVYIRTDRIRKALEAPYTGPYKVLSRHARSYKVQFPDGREDVVSLERLKPAFIRTPAPSPMPIQPGATAKEEQSDIEKSTTPRTANEEQSDIGKSQKPDPTVVVPRRNPKRKIRFSELNTYHVFNSFPPPVVPIVCCE